MPAHPNRSKRAPESPARTPSPAEVIALRERVQGDGGITAAQLACAGAVHTSLRAWQQWERGERRMHPAFWELARLKLQG